LLPIARRRNKMSIDKNFIVTELDFDELEVSLTEKLEQFIEEKLGMIASKQTEVSVEYQEYMDEGMRCFKDEMRCELFVEIKFNQYKYKHKPEHEERTESYGIVFEYKGRKPFYINGKFVTIQKTEIIYGISKDELGDMFDDLIMDC
jgi:hypothetical protein